MYSPNRTSTFSNNLNSTTTLRSPVPPKSLISPEAAKKRAALSVVRAAMALHRTTDFDSLPIHTQKVTRALASDEDHFLEAIEELNRTNNFLMSNEASSLNNTQTNMSLGGTLRSGLGSTARPLSSGTIRSSNTTQRQNYGGNNNNNRNPQEFFSPSSTQQQQQQQLAGSMKNGNIPFSSPRSPSPPPTAGRKRSQSRSPPHQHHHRGRSPPRHIGSARQTWSPKRPPQVVPTNINLQQVINEIKLRIPSMRRAIAATPASASDLRAIGENMNRIFTLIDANNMGALSLQEISSFGKRIGGQTQQLFRVSEMRARLHFRFPGVYPSPMVVYAEEYEKEMMLFHNGNNNIDQKTALILDSTTNNFGNTFAAMMLPPPPPPPHPNQQFQNTNNNHHHHHQIQNHSFGSAAGTSMILPSATTPTPQHTSATTPVPGNSSTTLLPPPLINPSAILHPKTSTKPNVKVRTPNPYEDTISREIFIDAVIAAANTKWASQAPVVLSRPGSGTGTGSMKRKLSRASFSSSSNQQNQQNNNNDSGDEQGEGSGGEKTSRVTSLGRRNSSIHGGSRPTSATTRLQRTMSIASTTSVGASSETPSTSTSTTAATTSLSLQQQQQQQQRGHNLSAIHAVTATTTSSSTSSLVGANSSRKKSAIPSDPEQRSAFFRVLRIVDPKNSGFVTLENLMKAIPRTNSVDAIIPAQFSTKSLFEQHDIDGDNKLTIEEFADMFRASFLPESSLQKSLAEAAAANPTFQLGRHHKKNDDSNNSNNQQDASNSFFMSTGEKLNQANALLAVAEAKKKEVEFSYRGKKIEWNSSAAKSTTAGGNTNNNINNNNNNSNTATSHHHLHSNIHLNSSSAGGGNNSSSTKKSSSRNKKH